MGAPKTENLTIMFTDIVGYTERTSRQSREENATLLNQHDRLLLPIVASFGGRRIKSIGDALLLTFHSPTDAVCCGMALQDAICEYNRGKEPALGLHIRVALTLGEVRVERGDIFGEPVNIAARIEGITPPDEVYFGEAVYLAMNKAEVPSELVGKRDFKGIPEPVNLYRVPQHNSTRLVVNSEYVEDSNLDFPYGGMHKTRHEPAGSVVQRALRQAVTGSGQLGEAVLERAHQAAPVVGGRLRQMGAHAKSKSGKAYFRAKGALQKLPPAAAKGLTIGLVILLAGTVLWRCGFSSPLGKVEGDMRAGHWEKVERYANNLLIQKPDNAEAMVILGHVAFSKKKRQKGVERYSQALALRKRLRHNPRLVDNTVEALGWVGRESMSLLREHPSRTLRRALHSRVVQEGYWGRSRAMELLQAHGWDRRVDQIQVAILDLEDAPKCSQRLDAVKRLREFGSKRAIEPLERATERKLRRKNRCLTKEGERTISALKGE